MENDLRNFVNLSYGPNAWNEVLRIQADIRLKKKEAIKEAKRKQAQKIENFILGVLLLFFLGAVGAVLYLILSVNKVTSIYKFHYFFLPSICRFSIIVVSNPSGDISISFSFLLPLTLDSNSKALIALLV